MTWRPTPRRRAHHPAAARRALHRLRDARRRAGLGPGGARRLRRLRRAPPGSGRRRGRASGSPRSGRTSMPSRPSGRACEAELPFLAEVPVTGTTGGFARLRGGGYVPRPHLGAGRRRLRGPGRALPRRALPLGRAQRPRPRLLGAGAARAARQRRRGAARFRHAGGAARRAAAPRGAALRARRPRLLEGPCRDHAAAPTRCCTPTATTWRWRASRCGPAVARIAAAAAARSTARRRL